MPQNSSTEEFRFERPVPREPRSPGHVALVQVQNRRREYLARHESYFNNLEHELADPILYERLVKRFQTVAERAAEGKAKGYGRTLEADLLRGESKLESLAQENGNGQVAKGSNKMETGLENWERPATDKEQGLQLWHAYIEDRFVSGQDEDFDYTPVDKNEDFDTLARSDAEEAWFEDEEPKWVPDEETGEAAKEPPKRQGETGIQDY
ncbi:Fc.00g035650.m01.CDS01 [Cosmosporella sp. VM-42]